MEETYDIIFTCSKCQMNHIAVDKHPVSEVWMVPDSVATSFDKNDGWFFHCVECEQPNE